MKMKNVEFNLGKFRIARTGKIKIDYGKYEIGGYTYRLLLPNDYACRQRFIQSTTEATENLKKGFRYKGTPFNDFNLLALGYFEKVHNELSDLIRTDEEFAKLLLLPEELLIAESYLMAGYFMMARSNRDNARFIQRFEEIAEEPGLFENMKNRIVGDGSNKKFDSCLRADKIISEAGLRMLVE